MEWPSSIIGQVIAVVTIIGVIVLFFKLVINWIAGDYDGMISSYIEYEIDGIQFAAWVAIIMAFIGAFGKTLKSR